MRDKGSSRRCGARSNKHEQTFFGRVSQQSRCPSFVACNWVGPVVSLLIVSPKCGLMVQSHGAGAPTVWVWALTSECFLHAFAFVARVGPPTMASDNPVFLPIVEHGLTLDTTYHGFMLALLIACLTPRPQRFQPTHDESRLNR